MSSFAPRAVFPALDSLPRSYYLGHHAAGLSRIRTMLSQINLVIECRDARIPLTSRNPMFETSLVGKERLIVYTKKDLAIRDSAQKDEKKMRSTLETLHKPSRVIFCDHRNPRDVRQVLKHIRTSHQENSSLVGSHLMIVGMPNVGKSSLLNALRRQGVNKGKAAYTGAQPGITRKIGTSVKILEDDETGGAGVYLLDTPGVFIPYVPNAESMLKLALCGSVKDTIIPPYTIADFLLYHINLNDPSTYREFHEPTNDVVELLSAMARRTGRLQKGGEPDLEATALWMVQRWRNGHLGQFMLDTVNEESLRLFEAGLAGSEEMSLSQARKAEKASMRDRARSRRSAAG